MPRVRVPVRWKITLPYLVLAITIALAAAFVISQVMLDSIQERFFNQLLETGRQSSDWMVREENRMLSTLRLAANTQGVAQAVQTGDSDGLRNLVLPAIVNAGEETVEFLDMQGISVLGLRPGGQAGEFDTVRGEAFSSRWALRRPCCRGAATSRATNSPGFSRLPSDAISTSAARFLTRPAHRWARCWWANRSIRLRRR